MPPILHVMRHGQGFHSSAVTKDGHLLRDAQLTEEGKEQCRQQCASFDRHEQIQLLLSSPLTRALQTCQHTFAPAIASHNLVITALPYAEEVSSAPADTGSPVARLREAFPTGVDFSLLREDWFEHDGAFSTEPEKVLGRARKLRAWIRARDEREVALVSHGFFNHFLTGEVDREGKQTTAWWKEAELRTYRFHDDDDDGEAMIYETDESLAKRGGLGEEDGEKVVLFNQPGKRGQQVETEN